MRNKNHIYSVFRIILDTYGIIMRNKNHIYCVFRIILDTYGIIMRNKNNIYCVFRIILDTWNYNENKNHIYEGPSESFDNETNLLRYKHQIFTASRSIPPQHVCTIS